MASAPGDDVRGLQRWLRVTGGLALLAGLVSISVPVFASVAVDTFIAWALLFAGALMTLDGWLHRTSRPVGVVLLVAAVTGLAGIYLVAAPRNSAISLTLALAAWGLAIGALRVVTAMLKRGDRSAGFIAMTGTLALLLGVVIVAEVSGPAAWVLGLVGGIGLVVYGITALTTVVGPRSAAGR